MDISFQPLQLVVFANLALTAAFQYVPGLRVKFAALASEVKRQIFLVLGVAIAVGWFVLTLPALGVCAPATGFVCEPTTAIALASALVGLVLGTGGMDGFFQTLPQMRDVVLTIQARDSAQEMPF